jgi:hypothetical protein
LHLLVFAAAAGAAGAAGAAVVVLAAFCIPPWPLQVPLPVEVLVVPSLHVVGGAASAWLGCAGANTATETAISPARIVFFIVATPVKLDPLQL